MRRSCASHLLHLSLGFVFATSAVACARNHTQPVSPSSHPYPSWQRTGSERLPGLPEPRAWPGSEAAVLPTESGASTAEPPAVQPATERTAPSLPRPSLQKLDASAIPDGEACLQKLRSMGVAFHEGPEKRGMKTSVVVDGPLGGITYRGLYKVPFLCDCRLAVALSWVGPDWRAAGISEVFFSGAYNYRMSREGRLSLHAWGLAIDVHEVVANGKRMTVTSDFERGLDDPCASLQPLNIVSCRFRERGMFRELLTPDYDADHHDHLHISIKPHGEDPVVRKPKQKAPVASGKRGKHRVKPRRTAITATDEAADATKGTEEAEPTPDAGPEAPTRAQEERGGGKRKARSKHRVDPPVDAAPEPEPEPEPNRPPKSKHEVKPAPDKPAPDKPASVLFERR